MDRSCNCTFLLTIIQNMTYNAPLYITSQEYRALLEEEGRVDTFIGEFFCVNPEMHTYPPVRELVDRCLTFSQSALALPDAGCALLTLLIDLHNYNISQTTIQEVELRDLARKRLVAYSLECPPFYSAYFEADAIKAAAEFIDSFYLRTYRLWRYLFCPTPLLEVSVHPTIDLVSVQSLEQLGYSPTQILELKKATTPVSDARTSKNQKKGAAEHATTEEKDKEVEMARDRPTLPFTTHPLPLSEATLFVPPPPKTEDEIAAEEVRAEITEAQEATTDQPADEEQESKEPEVDVEKLARAIEVATEAELARVKAQLLQELTTARDAPPSKKGGAK